MSGPALAIARRHVLVVDPDADTRASYEQSFSMAGFDVVHASDGRDALTKALGRPPSVVVMELRLPLINGVALCEILKRDRATAQTPILVVTAETGSVEHDRVRAVGADDVLVKPVALDVLAQRASELVAASNDRGPNANLGRRMSPPWLSRPSQSLAQPKRRAAVATTRRELTMSPPLLPRALNCPSCDRALVYQFSHTGGVSERHAEQWDYFCCSACGAFQYRHRTRKLRRLDATEEHWLQRHRMGGA